MTALILTAGILGAVIAYLAVGFRWVARPYVTRYLEEDIRQFPNLAKDPAHVEQERRFAAGIALLLLPVWPVHLLCRALVGSMARSAPLTDHELRQQLREREGRIAELERELGIRP